MESRLLNLLLVTVVLVLIDIYMYQAIKTTFRERRERTRRNIFIAYWLIAALTIAGMYIGIFFMISRGLRTLVFVWFFIHYFSKIFALPFLLIDDIRRGIHLLIRKFRKPRVELEPIPETEPEAMREEGSKKISRSDFLSRTGLLVATIPFATMNYGIISRNVYDYRIKRKTIYLPNLPKAFDGIRIGQISDIHSGSFYDKVAVQGGIDMLNAEKCDIVFFTGDLVNDETPEMKNYMDVFDKIKAPIGVFSILGNHDYGDYREWASAQAKQQNLEDLYRVHKNLGWDLLRNENRILKQGGESLAIIGVENWSSSSRFPKKGRLDIATQGTEESPVKLLLSHDPSHWNAQVTRDYKDIDMMFAGHTHGMQFGIEIGNLKWSPAQYVYPEWSGLYEKEQQKLYVNVGYGFLGYPGRIGILPEITIFELKKA